MLSICEDQPYTILIKSKCSHGNKSGIRKSSLGYLHPVQFTVQYPESGVNKFIFNYFHFMHVTWKALPIIWKEMSTDR